MRALQSKEKWKHSHEAYEPTVAKKEPSNSPQDGHHASRHELLGIGEPVAHQPRHHSARNHRHVSVRRVGRRVVRAQPESGSEKQARDQRRGATCEIKTSVHQSVQLGEITSPSGN